MQTWYLKTCAKIYLFIYHKSSIFFQALFGVGGGLKREGGLFNLVKRINGSKVSQGLTFFPGRYTAFSKNSKILTILHRELEHKVEKVKHMRLEVMRPKTKNNINFQPE